ncbi:MAG: mandelate racemase/muconate lactonizing enzyme family protein [Anaerolineae bacterium]
MSASVVTHVEIFKLNVRLLEPFRVAIGTIHQATNILVKVHTNHGLTGVGEGSPTEFIVGESQASDFEAAKSLARLLIGKNPAAVQERMNEINAFLVGNPALKCALDMALYDLLAKCAGLPLYALLAGEKRPIHTCRTVGIAEPEIMARQAAEIRNSGFPAVKVKVGTGRAEDVRRIQAVREAVGEGFSIRIDANQGWDPPEAVRALRDLARFDIQVCEQPVAYWNHVGLKYVREQSPIPIMADESLFDPYDAFKLASMGACDLFNIKLAKSGGIGAAAKIDAIAQAAGIRCMVGCMIETRLALSATAHFVSAHPNVRLVDLDSAFFQAEDPVVGGITYEGGLVNLPDAPGHGADIDPGFLAGLEGITVQ